VAKSDKEVLFHALIPIGPKSHVDLIRLLLQFTILSIAL